MPADIDHPERYLTTVEAADFVRLSPRTLERFRVEGTGPRFIKAGRGKRARVLYRLRDLRDWLERDSYVSTSEYPARR
ncbi:MAG: helix-turn-helix domain-containing protein [Rhodomicrobiaceae bacterium]